MPVFLMSFLREQPPLSAFRFGRAELSKLLPTAVSVQCTNNWRLFPASLQGPRPFLIWVLIYWELCRALGEGGESREEQAQTSGGSVRCSGSALGGCTSLSLYKLQCTYGDHHAVSILPVNYWVGR